MWATKKHFAVKNFILVEMYSISLVKSWQARKQVTYSTWPPRISFKDWKMFLSGEWLRESDVARFLNAFISSTSIYPVSYYPCEVGVSWVPSAVSESCSFKTMLISVPPLTRVRFSLLWKYNFGNCRPVFYSAQNFSLKFQEFISTLYQNGSGFLSSCSCY